MSKYPVIKDVEIQRTFLGKYVASYPCPYCREDLTSKESEIGEKDECPYCQGMFVVSKDSLKQIEEFRVQDEQIKQEKQEAKARKKAKRKKKEQDAQSIVIAVPQQVESQVSPNPQTTAEPSVQSSSVHELATEGIPQIAVQVNAPRQKPRPSNSLGISALILGILAFLICWIPVLGLIGVPLSGTGLLLAFIGLIASLVRGGTGIGYSIAALVLNGYALFLAIGPLIVIGSLFGADSTTSSEKQTVDQEIGIEEKETDSQENDTDSNEKVRPRTDDSEQREITNPDGWFQAGDVVTHGDVAIQIASISIGRVTLVGRNGETHLSEDSYLKVELSIRNTGSGNTTEYRGFMVTNQIANREDYLMLTDNLGNEYRKVTFEPPFLVKGQVIIERIPAGESVTDLLVFDLPAENAHTLNLELKATRFEHKGVIRFRIPVAKIKQE